MAVVKKITLIIILTLCHSLSLNLLVINSSPSIIKQVGAFHRVQTFYHFIHSPYVPVSSQIITADIVPTTIFIVITPAVKNETKIMSETQM